MIKKASETKFMTKNNKIIIYRSCINSKIEHTLKRQAIAVICISCLKSLQKDIFNTDFFSSFASEYRLDRFVLRAARRFFEWFIIKFKGLWKIKNVRLV